MTGGQRPQAPLLVAGVAGGVGTSTWIRILQLAVPSQPIQDLRDLIQLADELARLHALPAHSRNTRAVDFLITANTVTAAARVGLALRLCPVKPLLVVMHTAAVEPGETRAHLRKAEPYITARFDIAYRKEWPAMNEAPGLRLPERAKDISDAFARLPEALAAMYPPAPSAALALPPGSAHPPVTPTQRIAPRAGPPTRTSPPPWSGRATAIYRASQGG